MSKISYVYATIVYRGKRVSEILKANGINGLYAHLKNYIKKKNGDVSEEGTIPNFDTVNYNELELDRAELIGCDLQPSFSILIPFFVECDKGELVATLDSIRSQMYSNIEVIISCKLSKISNIENLKKEYDFMLNIQVVNRDDICIDEMLKIARNDFVCILEPGEKIHKNLLADVVIKYNRNPQYVYAVPSKNICKKNGYEVIDRKQFFSNLSSKNSFLHFSIFKNNNLGISDGKLFEWFKSLDNEKIEKIGWIGCTLNGQSIITHSDNEKTKCVAFYLPQYYTFEENDMWWGEGFTEWTNVKKAEPLYKGHNQPRIPGELGYYSLGDDCGLEVQKEQIKLAKMYGITGFCYYYYWFDGGKRLLDKPLDRMLENKDLDFPFCLCWANENWTKTWDGLKNEVLMPQTYQIGWEEAFIKDIVKYFDDERYIKVNGAPYILIYNIQDIPDAEYTIKKWREIATEYGYTKLHISAVRRDLNDEELVIASGELDSLTDFPPHLLNQVDIDVDDAYSYDLPKGQVKDYNKAANYYINMPEKNYTYFRTVILDWDNTARRGKRAYIFEKFTFEKYIEWLYAVKQYVKRNNRDGEAMIFINAWNEWAEGTCLEPTQKYSRKALESTLEALQMR